MEFITNIMEFVQGDTMKAWLVGIAGVVTSATVLAKLTKTKKDDAILGFLDDILNRIANLTLKDKRGEK